MRVFNVVIQGPGRKHLFPVSLQSRISDNEMDDEIYPSIYHRAERSSGKRNIRGRV